MIWSNLLDAISDAPLGAEVLSLFVGGLLALLWLRRWRTVDKLSVLDGDTFDCWAGGATRQRVRLLNVDCPEKGQPFAEEAKRFVIEWRKRQAWVQVSFRGRDRYRRRLCHLRGPEGSLARALIGAGLAYPLNGKHGVGFLLAKASRKGFHAKLYQPRPWQASVRLVPRWLRRRKRRRW